MPSPQQQDLTNATPAAPSGYQNVSWQHDSSLPRNASANVPITGGVNVQTGGYTILTTDCGGLIVHNSGSAGTFLLPAAPPFTQFCVFIENQGAGILTLSPNGLNIDGGSSSITLAQNNGVYVATDGINYFSSRGESVAPTTITLETNSVNNSSQTVLNLESGSGITVANPSGGNVTITYNGGGISGGGSPNIAPIGGPTATNNNWSNFTLAGYFPAGLIIAAANTWKIVISNVSASSVGHVAAFVVRRTLPGSPTYIDSTTIKVSGASAYNFPVGQLTSDVISLAVDAAHDYWFLCYFDSTAGNTALVIPAGVTPYACYYNTGNKTADANTAGVLANQRAGQLYVQWPWVS